MSSSAEVEKQIEKSVLNRLDTKSFGFFQLKMIIISGMGFFTDAYDLFCIGLLTRLIGRIYFQDNPLYVNYAGIVNSPYGAIFVKPGKLPINYDSALSAVALCGTLAGQLMFGRLGDILGRRACYGLALAIMIICAFGQAMSFGTTPHAIIGTLAFWRFMLGIGVGGDYPLSATIMSEYSSTISRGAYIGSVFAMQGIGYLIAAAITAIITAIVQHNHPNNSYPNAYYDTNGNGVCATASQNYKCNIFGSSPILTGDYAGTYAKTTDAARFINTIHQSNPPENDYVWRIVLCFGALPAALTMYFRLHMAETPRFTLHVTKDVTKFNNDMANMVNADGHDASKIDKIDESKVIHKEESVGTEDVPFSTFARKYGWQLLGAAMSWCLLDIAFYSQNLFQKDVFLQVGWLPPAERMSALRETSQVAKAQALIALGSTIPGYWFTVFTVDTLGRKNIQLMGFILMTAFMGALAGGYKFLLNPNTSSDRELSDTFHTRRGGWVTMYALCFFFANFGPNSTTFIVPAELFPTKWKATGHGFCAACGKAGAILGAFGFLFAANPREGETTWSFPCTYVTDTYAGSPAPKYGCKRKANCPTGRQQALLWGSGNAMTQWGISQGIYDKCNVCTPRVLSGCYAFGLGVASALAILAATNFLGMWFTLLIPETMGKSLEELNGEASEGDDKDEAALKAEMVGVPAGANQA